MPRNGLVYWLVVIVLVMVAIILFAHFFAFHLAVK